MVVFGYSVLMYCQILEYMRYFASFTIFKKRVRCKNFENLTRIVIQVINVACGPRVYHCTHLF